jgi:16S rRNA (guanine527-N7)-methyltransferase
VEGGGPESVASSDLSGASASDGVGLPPPPEAAVGLFGDRLALAVRFAEVLADTGVSHGLLGPREVPRLWERHVLNCAVVADAFPRGARLVDVGSGAGLPGVALAIVRPDLDEHLVEPMLRRTQWLTTVVEELALDAVTVHRGRAEDLVGTVSAPYVTARAVARLGKLARWCVPLLEPAGGTVVAMKGRSAPEELAEDRPALRRLGLVDAGVSEHGHGVLAEPVLTVDLRFARRTQTVTGSTAGRRSSGARSGGSSRGPAGRARTAADDPTAPQG